MQFSILTPYYIYRHRRLYASIILLEGKSVLHLERNVTRWTKFKKKNEK